MPLVFQEAVTSWRGTTYRSLGPIGSGGTASVFEVLATSGHHKGVAFALKVFEQIKNRSRFSNFMREIHFLRAVDHPAIMPVIDEGLLQDRFPFVVIPLQETTLEDCMGELEPFSKSECGLQLLSALSYLKRQSPPVIHRDIKPKNIFVNGISFVLGDFGLVSPFDELPPKNAKRPLMAWHYPTPELLKNYYERVKAAPESDVFQLGLVLAQLFTGLIPAKWNQTTGKITIAEVGEFPKPYGEGLRAIVKDMLIEDTKRRPTAETLLHRWQEYHLSIEKGIDDQELIRKQKAKDKGRG